MRSRGDRHPHDEVIVDIVLGRLVVQRHVAHQVRRRHGERLDPLAVDQELQVVRLAQALDVLVAVTRQPDREFVDAVRREVPGRDQAAARADRQALDVLLLGQIGIRPEGDSCRLVHPAHREPADLLRRAHVALEQGRREVADSHVVESVTRRVGRQQRGDVDFQRQQVPHRVVVLGAIQPAEGLRPARVGRLGGDPVEFAFERRKRLPVRALIRTAPARGRHLPGAQLAGHLLPGRTIQALVLIDQGVEFQPGRLQPAVVATQAVAGDEDAVRRVGVEGRGGRRRGWRAGERESSGREEPAHAHASYPSRPRAMSETQRWLMHLQLPG